MKILNPNDELIPYTLRELVSDIWTAGEKVRPKIILGTIMRVISDIVGLFSALAFSFVVTEVSKGSMADTRLIFGCIALWFVVISVKYAAKFVAIKAVFKAGIAIWLDTERKMLRVLFSKDSAWHEQESTGTKVKRIEKGAMAHNDVIRMWVINYIEITVRFIAIPIILFKFDLTVALLLVVFMVTFFAFSKYLQKKCIETAHIFNVHEDVASGAVIEAVGNIRTVRTLHIGESLLRQVQSYFQSLMGAAENRIDAFQFRGTITTWYSYIFQIGTIAFIVLGIIHGTYQVGFLILFSTYFANIWESVNELTNVSQDLIVAQQSIARMYKTIGREATPETGTQIFPSDWKALTIRNLSFSYGDNEALKDVTFTVPRGSKVGVVGLSGAGKSTLFKLLLRERTDYTGEIAIDTIPVGDILADEYYRRVSTVPQDTEVFNYSLKDNIALANPDAPDNAELLKKALSVSHVEDFLYKLHLGVDTLIGERGVKLSGGERQRLGIARAIYKNPEILLLDEATSHLDLESEEKIKDSLHQFFENVTAIVIAHRLTTIREMDKIIVIEKGSILEEGSFDELYKKKGRFYELWEKQKFD